MWIHHLIICVNIRKQAKLLCNMSIREGELCELKEKEGGMDPLPLFFLVWTRMKKGRE